MKGKPRMKELIEFLQRESKYQYTEFRLVINDNGHGLIHVMNRSSETFDFDLPLQGSTQLPETIQDQIRDNIDAFERKKIERSKALKVFNPPFKAHKIG